MKEPNWFTLIEQWKDKGMGEYGVTLPFLVGALGFQAGRSALSSTDVRSVLHEMVNSPVAGYVTEVRWCANIDAPVFSVARIGDANEMLFDSAISTQNGEVSMRFSLDLVSKSNLDCSGSNECLEKLVAHAASHVEAANFSRMRSSVAGRHEYGPFSLKEKQFITDTIGCGYGLQPKAHLIA